MSKEIKVSGLSHKRAIQGRPRLSRIMFHKIYGILQCVQKFEVVHNKINSLTPTKMTPDIVPAKLTGGVMAIVMYEKPSNKKYVLNS